MMGINEDDVQAAGWRTTLESLQLVDVPMCALPLLACPAIVHFRCQAAGGTANPTGSHVLPQFHLSKSYFP